MSEAVTQPLTGLARIEAKIDTNRVSETALSSSAGGLAFHNLSEVLEVAKLMALADVAVPKHLRGNPGACLAVTIQAVEWNFSPFQVANKSYSVNDRLAYEAQLIHAVILARAPIKQRPEHEYSGEGDKRKLKVWAETTDGQTVDYTSPELGKINPKNSPLWKSDPDQQLHYSAVRAWCRRHFPDVILGVYTKDEMEDSPKDVTPAGTGLAARLKGEATGGFNAAGVAQTLESENGRTGEDGGRETVTRLGPVDENSAVEVSAALSRGWLPKGYELRDGILFVPASVAVAPMRGSSVLFSHFDEIVTVDGVVLKTKIPPEPDPEFIRAGATAFSDGEPRKAPDDYSPEQCAAWLSGWDDMAAGPKGGA